MKKTIIFLAIITTILCSFSQSMALTKLYETKEKQILNSGTNLTKYKRLTDKGWLAINIIDVDLKDKNTSVGVLTSENGLHTFQTVKTMLTNTQNGIAAINADFFNGNYQKGNIIGMTIQEGKVLTSASRDNVNKDTMASFYMEKDGEASFSFFTNQIQVNNITRREAYTIYEMNKLSDNYEYPVLYTREWGEESIGFLFNVPVTELVVENGVVKEIREGLEATKIPEDGFVVTATGASVDEMKRIFHKGDKVDYEIEFNIDQSKLEMAVSGGAILVQNGKVAEFSHLINGSHPRTAIGLSMDGETLYLITVDGRQASSIGLTQTELAELLIEKGIYQAMNLDGGGSTTMVARELGDEDVTVENSPSQGSLRMVPNAVAVFNTEKTGKLDQLLIEVDGVNVFVGCQKELIVKGFDAYYHPVEIDANKIKWSCSGVDGRVKNNIFTAGEEAGPVTLFANIGKAQGVITLDVLSEPNELTITPKKIATTTNGEVKFQVRGQNKNGYYANINDEDVTWNVEGNATIKDGVFTSKEEGNYIVSVTEGKATAYALVSVTNKITRVLDDFEKENFYFQNYPEEVTGSCELTKEESYEGKKSATLEYDFTGTEKTRGAYLRWKEGIVLEEGSEKLKVHLLATSATNDSIKAKIIDANDKVNYLLLCKGLAPTGWQELELDLRDIALPATLTDLYVVQEHAEEQTKGKVYFDNLMLEFQSKVVESDIEIPMDIKGKDEDCIEEDSIQEDVFQVIISPEWNKGTLLEQLKNKKLNQMIHQRGNIVIYPYANADKVLVNVDKTIIAEKNYAVRNLDNLSIITMDISDGGLRLTDSSQWLSIQQDLQQAKQNVLIVFHGNLEDFKDEAEKQLWIDALCEMKRTNGKNIWVIQTGTNTEYSMKRGIKYLTLASHTLGEATTLQDLQETKCIVISVDKEKMTYEMKNVF